MKIYTKKGDKGLTGLLGGTRVSKAHIRIEAYGTIDELNSHIGLLNALDLDAHFSEAYSRIQNSLFVIGSHLAADPEKNSFALPPFEESETSYLEKEIDAMEKELPELKSFILPGGSVYNAEAHVARCICRRAERNVVRLSVEEIVPEGIIKYLNRLSDYLFVQSRRISQLQNTPEIPWIPNS